MDTGGFYAVKSMKKDHVMKRSKGKYAMLEKRVLSLGSNFPYMTELHSTFSSPVRYYTHKNICILLLIKCGVLIGYVTYL